MAAVFRYVGSIATLLCALGTCAVSAAEAPSGQPIDGITCDQAEGAVFHIHQHLAIAYRGKPVAIPGDVGRPLVGNCLYWIHTHTPDGLIHIEAPKFRTFTLGNFFDVWGEPLSAVAVASARVAKGRLRAYVDGRLYAGDPRKIPLAQHTDIVLEAGPPYVNPQPFTDWQGQ